MWNKVDERKKWKFRNTEELPVSQTDLTFGHMLLSLIYLFWLWIKHIIFTSICHKAILVPVFVCILLCLLHSISVSSSTKNERSLTILVFRVVILKMTYPTGVQRGALHVLITINVHEHLKGENNFVENLSVHILL